MDHDRVQDEFMRIETVAELEKKREIIASYRNGLSEMLKKVEKLKYILGRLDERLEIGDEI